MRHPKKDIPDRQLAAFGQLTVARFMEKDVQYGHLRTKADVLASQMIEGFGAMPIVDEKQRLVGIVSEYDLLAALERGQRWSELSAQDIMTPNPYSVRPETDIGTLIHVFRASHLIRVPVVDAEGRLIGIVARRDILRGYLNYGVDVVTS
ncbi:MAG: CBS domain-containing protein [Nitrospirae bacterium]|nr:CBS domain-containing protein [Nitrospirota bacterium]